MLNRNYVIRRMHVYKFGISDFFTKESKVKGKKGALKMTAKIWDIFQTLCLNYFYIHCYYDNGNMFSLDYLYDLTDTFNL